jgi:hypothetical protein
MLYLHPLIQQSSLRYLYLLLARTSTPGLILGAHDDKRSSQKELVMYSLVKAHFSVDDVEILLLRILMITLSHFASEKMSVHS